MEPYFAWILTQEQKYFIIGLIYWVYLIIYNCTPCVSHLVSEFISWSYCVPALVENFATQFIPKNAVLLILSLVTD